MPSLPVRFSANQTLPVLSTLIPVGPALPFGTCHSDMFKADGTLAFVGGHRMFPVDMTIIDTMRRKETSLLAEKLVR